MQRENLIFIVFLLFLPWQIAHGSEVFVSPYQSCGNQCTGSLEQPYEDLLIALVRTSSLENVTIILLYSNSTDHYVLENKEFTPFQDIMFTNLEIKPLFCDEAIVQQNSSLLDKCVTIDQKISVYLKVLTFSIGVRQSFLIRNIILDGIEAFKSYNNLDSANLQYCYENRIRCCKTKELSNENFSPTLLCHPDYPGQNLMMNGFVNEVSNVGTARYPLSLTFEKIEVQNFWATYMRSFVQFSDNFYYNVTFKDCIINDTLFIGSFIQYGTGNKLGAASPDQFKLTLDNIKFLNYNYWSHSQWREAFLFYVETKFMGTFIIRDSTFMNIQSAAATECYEVGIENEYMPKPTNNLFKTYPHSRSDIWSLYHEDLFTQKNPVPVSSLIYISNFNGSLIIENSVFKNITGTLGSVLRIDGFVYAYLEYFFSSITIRNSIFDNNFAIKGFANIVIAKYLNGMNQDPLVIIENCEFLNSAGCPGSYGNVGILNYWSSSPTTTTGLIYPNNQLPSLAEFERRGSRVRVFNSTFKNNLLAVSNSLAIIGSYWTTLENNRFLDNGGPTQEIAEYLVRNSYFLSMKPSQPYIHTSKHFGQSTAVFCDRVLIIKSKNNTFQGNWALWEGSQALATALTIKHWIPMLNNTLFFTEDKFIDHLGVPVQYSQMLMSEELKENAYTPPLISISLDEISRQKWNIFTGTENLTRQSGIIFKNVTIANNLASYDLVKGCSINNDELSAVCNAISSQKRQKTGLLKFLTPSEALENANSNELIENVKREAGMSLINTKIINNTLLGEGCLFPTLWVRSYVLDTLTIENNKINPFSADFPESSSNIEPQVDRVLQSRDGLFCSFQSESVSATSLSKIIAINLHVKENIGTIFNLYPSEKSILYLSDSLFVNNQCQYSSLIMAFEASEVLSHNNIFIRNTNSLGLSFISSQKTIHRSVFNSYLANFGKHAVITYINRKAVSSDLIAKIYWNVVSPKFKIFSDSITPQGGLYFLSLAYLEIVNSDFVQNNVSTGSIVSLGSIIQFDLVNFYDHQVFGSSIIGNFLFSSIFTMLRSKISNFSLKYDTSIPLQPSILTLMFAKFTGEDLDISQSFGSNEGALFRATNIDFSFKNVNITNFHAINENTLLNIDFSNVIIQNLNCDNITSLFKLSSSVIISQDIIIKKLIPRGSTQMFMNMIDSSLNLRHLEYFGGSDSGDYLSLISGSNNNIKITEANFLDAIHGENNIFDLKNTFQFVLTRSTFKNSKKGLQTTVFNLESGQLVHIEDCVLMLTGPIMAANNIANNFNFIDNIILTDSHVENIQLIESSSNISFIKTQILQQGNNEQLTSPEFQILLLNNNGKTQIHKNSFISLYGSKGIVKIQSLTNSYLINSTENIFIDNTGSNGGALHLDASLSSTSKSLPTTNIENCVFILNNAAHLFDLKGKGGAIYQTTSSQTTQITNIKNSFFTKNSADTIGGAIYFDYLPPRIDELSKFSYNYAKRPNNIGSYPVKVGYYGSNKPSEIEPYLSEQTSMKFLLEDDISKKWENIPSGLTVHQDSNFVLLDMFNQVFYDDNSSSLEIYPEGLSKEERYSFTSKLSVKAENGIYTLNNFKFSYKIGQSIKVNFVSTAIQNRKIPLDIPLTSSDSITLEVQFRQCGRGESVSKTGNTITCVECQAGFWQTSPLPNAASCKPCDLTSTFCLGADNVGARAGYWRLNQTADLVLACPRPESCLGDQNGIQQNEDNANSTDTCQFGYKDNLCSNCEAGWAKASNGACTNCNTDAWYYIRVILTLAVQVGIIAQGVRGTMNLSQEFKGSEEKNMNAAVLMRILTNYLQLTSLVTGIPVTWPNFLKSFSSTTNEVSSVSDNVFTIDCIFKSESVNGIRIAFIKLILGSAGAFLFIFLGIIFWVLYFTIKRFQIFRNKRFVNNIVTTTVVICYMMQPSAILASFAFFQCSNLYREDNQMSFFKKDYDVACWTGTHLYWALGFGLPLLLIWAVCLPLIVFTILRRNKTKLDTEKIAEKYSFLYGGYTNRKYYWELVIMTRKFLLIAITIGASYHSTNLELYMTVLLIILALVIHKLSNPYSDPQLNKLESLSLISAAAINFCGIYFQFIPSRKEGLDIFIIVCSLLANLIFLLVFGKFYLIIQLQKLLKNEKIAKLLDSLLKKLCCCFKSFTLNKLLQIIENTNLKKTDLIERGEELENLSQDKASSSIDLTQKEVQDNDNPKEKSRTNDPDIIELAEVLRKEKSLNGISYNQSESNDD